MNVKSIALGSVVVVGIYLLWTKVLGKSLPF